MPRPVEPTVNSATTAPMTAEVIVIFNPPKTCGSAAGSRILKKVRTARARIVLASWSFSTSIARSPVSVEMNTEK